MTEYFIKLVSGGRVLEISNDSVCKLVEGGLSGFDCTDFDVHINSYAVRQGGSVGRRRFCERELSLTFEIAALGDVADAARSLIVSMLDPRRDLELEVTKSGRTRRITVIPYGKARFTQRTFFDYIEVELHFIAPAVFFGDTSPTVISFGGVTPILTFPMNLMAGAGTASGIRSSTDRAAIRNRGDAECGIVAKIRASGGCVVYPTISCGGEFVKCNVTLSDGDMLVIDTRERMKNIYINGERFFSFDRDSVFFSLPSGESEVLVSAEEGEKFIDAELEFTPIYFGA